MTEGEKIQITKLGHVKNLRCPGRWSGCKEIAWVNGQGKWSEHYETDGR